MLWLAVVRSSWLVVVSLAAALLLPWLVVVTPVLWLGLVMLAAT